MTSQNAAQRQAKINKRAEEIRKGTELDLWFVKFPLISEPESKRWAEKGLDAQASFTKMISEWFSDLIMKYLFPETREAGEKLRAQESTVKTAIDRTLGNTLSADLKQDITKDVTQTVMQNIKENYMDASGAVGTWFQSFMEDGTAINARDMHNDIYESVHTLLTNRYEGMQDAGKAELIKKSAEKIAASVSGLPARKDPTKPHTEVELKTFKQTDGTYKFDKGGYAEIFTKLREQLKTADGKKKLKEGKLPELNITSSGVDLSGLSDLETKYTTAHQAELANKQRATVLADELTRNATALDLTGTEINTITELVKSGKIDKDEIALMKRFDKATYDQFMTNLTGSNPDMSKLDVVMTGSNTGAINIKLDRDGNGTVDMDFNITPPPVGSPSPAIPTNPGR